MKKRFAIILCIMMSLTMLAGCNGKDKNNNTDNVELDVPTILQDVYKTKKFSLSRQELDADALNALYDIDATKIESFNVSIPMMNVKADEIAVFKVNEENKQLVRDGIAKRQADLEESWSKYLPDVYEMVQKSVTKEQGDYIIYVVHENSEDVATYIAEQLK